MGCPRSGTTLVHTAVMGHDQVSALSDEMLIIPFFSRGISTFTFGNEHEEEKRKGRASLFDAMASLMATDQTRALGIKCCTQTTEQADIFVESVQRDFPDAKIIITDRRDLVAQYGSLQSARRTGTWHSWYSGAKEAKTRKIKLWRPLFIRYAVRCLNTMQALQRLRATHDVHECVYEDILMDRDAVLQGAVRFLGLESVPITWLRTQKVKAAPSEYITSYDALTRLHERLRQQHAEQRLSARVHALVRTIESASSFYYRHLKRSA